MASGLATSQAMTSPRSPKAAAAAASPSRDRPIAMTCAPAEASRYVAARPIPLVAPVMRAILFWRCIIVSRNAPNGDLSTLVDYQRLKGVTCNVNGR